MTTPIKFFDGGLTKEAKRVSIGIDQSYTGFAFTAMDMDSGEWMTTVTKAPGTHVDRLYFIGGKETKQHHRKRNSFIISK